MARDLSPRGGSGLDERPWCRSRHGVLCWGALLCGALLLARLGAGPQGGEAKAASDGSVGICTRKEEFKKRQEALDPLVAKLSAQANPAKAKRDVQALDQGRQAGHRVFDPLP